MPVMVEDTDWAVGCEQWAMGGKTRVAALKLAKQMDETAHCDSPHFAWKAPGGPTYNTAKGRTNIPENAERP